MPRHIYGENEFVGQKFGTLHIDYKTTMKTKIYPIYMCTCDCGNRTLMHLQQIKNYKNCGCIKNNKGNYFILEPKSIIRESKCKEKVIM